MAPVLVTPATLARRCAPVQRRRRPVRRPAGSSPRATPMPARRAPRPRPPARPAARRPGAAPARCSGRAGPWPPGPPARARSTQTQHRVASRRISPACRSATTSNINSHYRMTAHRCNSILRALSAASRPVRASWRSRAPGPAQGPPSTDGQVVRGRIRRQRPSPGDTKPNFLTGHPVAQGRGAGQLCRGQGRRARRQPATTLRQPGAPATSEPGAPPATTGATVTAAAHRTCRERSPGDGRKAMIMTIDASDIDVRRLPVVVDSRPRRGCWASAAPRRTSWCGPAGGRLR